MNYPPVGGKGAYRRVRQRVKAQTIFANYLQTVELLTLIFAWQTVIVVCLVIATPREREGRWGYRRPGCQGSGVRGYGSVGIYMD